MLSTKEIIRGMCEKHFIEIRLIVKKGSFNKELIPILDKYRSGEFTEEEVREDTIFTLNEYKLLERRLYNILVNYYKISPKLELDTILSQAFHAMYSMEENSSKDQVAILENIFNKMQARHLAEEGLDILRQLVNLKKDSELHTVYHHLYSHYINRNFSKKRSLILLTQFFNKMNNYSPENAKDDIRQLIFIYKQLRLLSKETNNPLSNVIYRICQLTMVVHFEQTQLLYHEKMNLQKLILKCERELSLLPGNFENYYLNNILLQLKLKWAAKSKDHRLFNEIEKILTDNPKILEANNFYFAIIKEEMQSKFRIKSVFPIGSARNFNLLTEKQFKLSNLEFPQII